MKRKHVAFPLIVSALFGGIVLSSCGSNENPQENVEVTLSSIKVSNPKTSYFLGDSLVKPTVTAVYSDGSIKVVTDECTFSPTVLTVLGQNSIVVSYKGKETIYNVTVSENPNPSRILQKIEIQGTPINEYHIGDALVKPTVIATFSEGTQDVTNNCQFTYDFSSTGEKQVVISYTNNEITKTTSYSVTVSETPSKLRFAIFADVQLCAAESGEGKATNLGETANAPLALEQHLKYIKSQNINVVLMNGDITNQANQNYYDYFEEIVTKVYGSDKSQWPEFVWNMGNHEWWEGTTEKDPRTGNPGSYTLPEGRINSVGLFNEYARIDSSYLVKKSNIKYASNVNDTLPSYYKVIDGVPFLVISGINSDGLITSELKDEISSWLNDIKKLESVKAGGPIFVQYHYPLGTSMTHGQGSHEANTSVIDEIFASTPNAIIFTGDTHFPGANERAINQDNYTTINLGTSSYSRMVDSSAVIAEDFENVTGGIKTAQGDRPQGNIGYLNAYTPTIQIIDVMENNSTKIQRKMSNVDGTARKVGEDWIISAINSKSDFTYTNARFQNPEASKMLYGKNGVSWEDSDKVTFGVNEEAHQMTVQFKDPVEHNFVEHFDIKVNGVDHYFASNYYKYPEERENNYFVIENLASAGAYNVEVIAYDFFDNPSLNKLIASTNDETKAIDPIDLYFADGNYNYSDIETRNNFEYTSEGSHSSSEFYYRGIQKYNAGAILGRLVYQNLKVTDYLSLESGEGTKPVVKFDVKNLKSDDLVFGLSVVTSGNTWKTDFGAEYQQTVSGKEWTTLSWDLYSLFGISSKEALENITIKAKSKAASANGYEMNFLVDNIDITNEGGTPIPPSPSTDRGVEFSSSEDYIKDFDPISTTDGKFIMDIKPTTGTDKKVCFGLFDGNWANRVGWFTVQMDASPVCDGVTVRKTTDGYLRITVDFAKLSESSFEPGHATEVSHLQIHKMVEEGSWTTASGYVDVFPVEGETIRGQRFLSGTDLEIVLPENIALTETITLDVKFDDPTKTNKVAIMLGQGWKQYFGYFIVHGDGTLSSTYNGVTIVVLDDAYYRVAFNLSELTKVEDCPAPSDYIDLIYIRGGWSEGDGYIDVNSTEGTPVRGDLYVAGQDFDRKLGDISLEGGTFAFDVRFLDKQETYINVMLGDGWSNYFGYYKIKSDGTLSSTYNGVTIAPVGDGYYRVTFDLSLLDEKNGDTVLPTEKINMFYIRGGWSTANCYVDLNPVI